jgi:hypothetical protein
MPELRVVHVNKRGTKVHMRHFWDVTAPSVIGHPQQVRQVTVKMVSDTLGYIEVLSFSPRGQGGSADKIERAQRGAKADACRKPGSCENGEPRQMSSAASYPRLFFTIAAPFKDDND